MLTFSHIFDYFFGIRIANYINYKTKAKIAAYIFAFFIYSKTSIAKNIMVFEDLNIFQIRLDKINLYWADYFMI